MKIRDDLKVQAASSGKPEDFDKYKNKRNEVSTKLKTAKEDYFRKKFSQDDQQPKDVWKTTFSLLGKNKSEFPSQILIGQRLLSHPGTIADEMNKYFIDKVAKLNISGEQDIPCGRVCP